MAYDDKTIEGLERDRWQDEEIDRRDAVGVVREKRPPAWDGGRQRRHIYRATVD
jgi:hypothetical protein